MARVGASQPAQPPPPQQPSSVGVTITSDPGEVPQIAVPDFIAPGADKETAEMAKLLAQVLFDDLSFEREYEMIPRDTYASIPPARSLADAPFDRWRELGADALVLGSLTRSRRQRSASRCGCSTCAAAQQVLGREYKRRGQQSAALRPHHGRRDPPDAEPAARRGPHQAGLLLGSGPRPRRQHHRRAGNVKEIFIADYDGANQRRVTVNRQLNVFPSWSPDGRAIAYTSYRRGYPDIFISLIYQGTMETPTSGTGQNWLPVFSPDGARIAFTSNRDGNSEIYVMNRDGSAVRRLTNHPAIDVTPTWSPSGEQIAFTSDRTGSPQIWVIGADGLNLRRLTSESYADRPTWSPAPYNEIAYAARTEHATTTSRSTR